MISEAVPLNTSDFILFLNHKRLVGGKVDSAGQKYFVLTYYLFSRKLKYTIGATIIALKTFLWDKDKIKVCTQVKRKAI